MDVRRQTDSLWALTVQPGNSTVLSAAQSAVQRLDGAVARLEGRPPRACGSVRKQSPAFLLFLQAMQVEETEMTLPPAPVPASAVLAALQATCIFDDAVAAVQVGRLYDRMEGLPLEEHLSIRDGTAGLQEEAAQGVFTTSTRKAALLWQDMSASMTIASLNLDSLNSAANDPLAFAACGEALAVCLDLLNHALHGVLATRCLHVHFHIQFLPRPSIDGDGNDKPSFARQHAQPFWVNGSLLGRAL